jgi:hypothetical protein
MQIRFSKEKINDPVKFIRRCGYGQMSDRHSGEKSYSKRFGALLYPRFHVYIKAGADSFTFNLHLDQRQPSYRGVTAHSGEYDGEVVEREGERLRLMAENFLNK